MGYTTDESKLTKDILTYFEELKNQGHPIYWEHRSGQGGLGYKKGAPDFFAVYNGIHIEIECKGSDGKQSAMQRKFQWKCETIYNIHYCCPHSFAEFLEFFSQFTKKSR